jgi:predicted  nucleic acid-binding Zn-ribbon protein
LKDQLQALLELQTIDAKVKELEAAIAKLPERLEPARRDLAKLESMVAAERARLDESQTWRKQQEAMLEREQEALRQARSKLSASKNGKEYNAANREVDNKRKAILDREAELKKVVEAMTTSSTGADAHGKDVQALRDTLATEEAKINEQITALRSQASEAIAIRDVARAKIEKSWLKTYDSLASKKGYAVAPVIKGMCQGCHMKLPPQLNNILARLESIETCPRCGRMVYRQELITGTEEPKPE